MTPVLTQQTFAQHFNSAVHDSDLLLYKLYKETGNVQYRNKIVVANRWLIAKETNNCLKSLSRFTNGADAIVSFDMLYPEAVIGFIDGIEKYKPLVNGKSVKIITYCAIRMRKSLSKYNIDSKLVRVSKIVHEQASKAIKQSRLNFSQTDSNCLHIECENKLVKHAAELRHQRTVEPDVLTDCTWQTPEEKPCLETVITLVNASPLPQKDKDVILIYFGLVKGKRPHGNSVKLPLAKLKQWITANKIKNPLHV